LTMS